MSDAPTQSQHYVVVVDKKRNDVIACLLEVAKIYHEIFAHLLLTQGVSQEDLTSFVKEFAAKEHALGWCVDPDCKYPKPSTP